MLSGVKIEPFYFGLPIQSLWKASCFQSVYSGIPSRPIRPLIPVRTENSHHLVFQRNIKLRFALVALPARPAS